MKSLVYAVAALLASITAMFFFAPVYAQTSPPATSVDAAQESATVH